MEDEFVATTMDCSVKGCVTVSVADPPVVELLIEPTVAEMVAVPGVTASTKPGFVESLLIVATPGLEELQVTAESCWVLPPVNMPVATNCWVVPGDNEGGTAGVTLMEMRPGVAEGGGYSSAVFVGISPGATPPAMRTSPFSSIVAVC